MACSINELPSDVLLEILYKLPLNLIHRCKCVCKLWSSLISQPYFPAQYLLRTKLTPPPNPTLYFHFYIPKNFRPFPLKHSTYNDHRKSWSQDSPTLSFGFLPQPVRLLCTSNGLALCTTSYDCECIYYVCNPITKHWLTLPPPPTCTNFALAGLVSYNHHFKVVRLVAPFTYTNAATLEFTEIQTSSFNAETFDSRANLWKVSPLITIPHSISFLKPTKVVEYKGNLYWESSEYGPKASKFMAFDPTLEKCRLIQVLGDIYSRPGMYATGVSDSGEHLYHAHMETEINMSTTWRIWRLIEAEAGDDEWCLEHTFQFRDLKLITDGNCIPPSDYDCYLLSIDPIDPNVLYFSTRGNPTSRDPGIVSLNIKTGKVEPVYSPYYWKDPQVPYSAYQENIAFPFVPPSWPTSLPKIHHLDMIKE
ncbi:putative F-box/kelch-repeat protein At3g22730 [Mercurialis annua]|uniref:putative F-box/kelch-repeat protein At3g22730 n=1 Tax=Mercurialis annua TaxID=3986 RepID=UPI00215F6457|nr:putative F-box/kelch-repeat protein At3g22730 [Mercurialis annua]